ncbi:MAG: Mrp/NBP35 family ATP-binding protein [Phycisphaerales bacterium]|nr:MAG: Mrp/NBP35 family ATP-binding protein [Phycisphaerales bacterium]
MALTPEHVRDALSTVEDPELHQDLVSLGMVKDVVVDGKDVSIVVELTTPACPLKDKIGGDVEAAVRSKAAELDEEIGEVKIDFTADVRKANERVRDADNPLPKVKNIVAVGAGKGGVGKSTVAVSLAVGLARHGAAVGLLDGDIYGPSLTTMLGLDQIQPMMAGEMLLPFEVHGIKAMTIGRLVSPDSALIWRGPMAHGAFSQLATQTEWGELDYLIVDLPPGTGDVPLTLGQLLPLTGAVIVCTPQKVAVDDAVRAARMFQQLGVDVLGIVENMSYFIGDDGKEYDIFGRGGAEAMAERLGLPFLGGVPINTALRENCDTGNPLANFAGDDGLARNLDDLCRNLAAQISIAAATGGSAKPTMTIS